MIYEELRDLWMKGGFAAVGPKLPVPFLLPLEPWVRNASPRRTQPGPGPLRALVAQPFPEDLDITDTSRNPRNSLSLVHSQLGDRFPAMGVAIQLVRKTERNVYAHIAVGRSDNNDVVVDQPSVSRFHSDFRTTEGAIHVRDAKSRNGTRRNGEPVGDAQGHKVNPGDVVAFGDASFLFCLPTEHDLAQALGRLTSK
jgi:hypothetical protein